MLGKITRYMLLYMFYSCLYVFTAFVIALNISASVFNLKTLEFKSRLFQSMFHRTVVSWDID